MRAIIEPEGPPDRQDARAPFWKRLAWFMAIAAGAAAATAAVAWALKALLPAA
jgi:hypothetical protein